MVIMDLFKRLISPQKLFRWCEGAPALVHGLLVPFSASRFWSVQHLCSLFYSSSQSWLYQYKLEVQWLKCLGLTLSHDLSWASHISRLASKARRWLGILHRTKSLLGTSELLSTCKAFIHSSMEYCSPLLAGGSASHLAQLDSVETKAFKIFSISCDEAESMGVSLSHHRQVGGLSVFYRLLSGLAPSALSMLCPPSGSAVHTQSTINPFLVKLPTSRITTHLHSFVPLFCCLWSKLSHSLQSHSSLQVFKTAVLFKDLVKDLPFIAWTVVVHVYW